MNGDSRPRRDVAGRVPEVGHSCTQAPKFLDRPAHQGRFRVDRCSLYPRESTERTSSDVGCPVERTIRPRCGNTPLAEHRSTSACADLAAAICATRGSPRTRLESPSRRSPWVPSREGRIRHLLASAAHARRGARAWDPSIHEGPAGVCRGPRPRLPWERARRGARARARRGKRATRRQAAGYGGRSAEHRSLGHPVARIGGRDHIAHRLRPEPDRAGSRTIRRSAPRMPSRRRRRNPASLLTPLSAFEPEDRGFESLPARQSIQRVCVLAPFKRRRDRPRRCSSHPCGTRSPCTIHLSTIPCRAVIGVG